MSVPDMLEEPCPLGGLHHFTQPRGWVGASCLKCHKTWEGRDYRPTWPDPEPT